MKKILAILLLSTSLCLGQGNRLQPGGVPTPTPVFDISSITLIISNSLTVVNSNIYNLYTYITNINNFISNYYVTDGSLGSGFIMQPVYQSVQTNEYYWDWGQTNAGGFPQLWASLKATNTVQFLGPTNLVQWRPFSFDVVASAGNELIYIPTNLTFLKTNYGNNNLYISNQNYALYLTNGSLFRMSFQSNIVFEIKWSLLGQ